MIVPQPLGPLGFYDCTYCTFIGSMAITHVYASTAVSIFSVTLTEAAAERSVHTTTRINYRKPHQIPVPIVRIFNKPI